ncbi:MAG: response regulator [Nitrospirota bacterium]
MMKNLLLLEEDQEGREALAKVLRKRGFTVRQARDEATALAILAASPPMDMVLAGATERDRSEFLADVRERKPQVPVIFLSDYCGPEARLRGLAFGAFTMSRSLNFYINMRPVGLHELERLIRIVLGRRHAGRGMELIAA